MGQGDIIDLVKRKKRWLSTKEIASYLHVGYSSTIVKLRKLRKSGELKFKKDEKKYYYTCK
jgi:Mn-dependent DtxR family transcriptional regulator